MGSRYGDWLKRARESAGMTQQELADAAIMTRSHISHIETGRRIPNSDDAKRLDQALGTGDVLSTFRPRSNLVVAEHFEAALHFEQQAMMIREFALSYVPGLLQTKAYASAVMRSGFPPLSDEKRDEAVVSRLERAKILCNEVMPVVWAVLDEAVLRRPVGGPKVMEEQILHIVELAKTERVRVHVLPFRAGPQPLLHGIVKLMWFEDQPPVAYAEGVRMGQVHDDPSTVQEIQTLYDLALGAALPPQESLDLLNVTAKEYGTL